MPRIQYQDFNFRADALGVIQNVNAIASSYRAQGYDLTLRQIYYQFVARGLLPNSDKSYKRLGGIVNDGRLAGMIDWTYVTDRTRFLRTSPAWESPSQLIEAAAEQFDRDIWAESGQAYRPEVWVEKDALVGVIGQACEPLHVPFFSCRGYVSQSEMWAAGRRMRRTFQEGFTPVVIHLGDHDPSGIDMTRDIGARLALFAEEPVNVVRIALTMDQVEQYAPPPNPAKITDSRAVGYIQEYGDESWELDALEPSVLTQLIQDEVEKWMDREEYDDVTAQVGRERDSMQEVASRWDDLTARWSEVEDLLQ